MCSNMLEDIKLLEEPGCMRLAETFAPVVTEKAIIGSPCGMIKAGMGSQLLRLRSWKKLTGCSAVGLRAFDQGGI